MESHSSIHLKFHPHLPLFKNFALCLGDHPISFPQWKDKGINTLSENISVNALRSFFFSQTWILISTYPALPFSSTCNSAVPYGHTESPGEKTWSLIQFIKYVDTHSSLSVQKKLCKWIVSPSTINWNIVWSKIDLSSRNPNHQMIHYNFLL